MAGSKAAARGAMGVTIALLIALVFTGMARAEPFPLSPGMPVQAPMDHAALLEDPAGDIDPATVLKGALDGEFQPLDGKSTSVGITRSAWWVRFEAVNPGPEPVEWVINFPFPLTDYVDLYHQRGDGPVDHVAMGDRLPYDSRPLPGEGFAAPLTTGPGETSTVYVRLHHEYGDGIDVYFQVSSPKAYSTKQHAIWMVLGLFAGGAMLLFLYNVVIFAVVRERVYFWYLAYFAATQLAFAAASGFGNRFLWPDRPGLGEFAAPLFSALAFMLVVQFSRTFLETRRLTPRFDRVLRVVMAYFALPPILFLAGEGALAAQTVMTGGLALTMLPVYGAMLWWRGETSARIFTLAWAVWFVSVALLIGRFVGLAPTNDLTLRVAWMGLLGEAVLFALALADRIRLLQRQKVAAEQQARLALERSEAELKSQVAARTRELQDTNDTLSDLNRQKDRFFSIIAHDLMGPFSVLIGMSDLLKRRISTLPRETIAEYGGDISTAAQNLHKLLENLLSWARLQQGAMSYDPQPYPLNSSVADVTELFAPVARQKGIDLTAEMPPELSLRADRKMIETALRNLVSNALKFSRSGDRVRITVAQSDTETRIAVTDTGIGMNAKTRTALFSLDQKLSVAGTEGETGTGLGLRLSHELVERHGGRIEVESEPGAGSTFTIVLPS
ncbi:MAG: sensor histidine kinase [Pseudomonadota bacterium]|nr:sensor histidine kinase [Pseudomonadota bacterium]